MVDRFLRRSEAHRAVADDPALAEGGDLAGREPQLGEHLVVVFPQ
jgi:hypothetical protein